MEKPKSESPKHKDSQNNPSENQLEDQNRRQFLGGNLGLVAIGAGFSAQTPTGQASAQEAGSPVTDSEDLFQPESYWKDRMTPPNDGKKLGWFIDTQRCFGCHACEVSCKAENDVPLGNYIRQTIYQDEGSYPKVARLFLPMSCQHCEDAPCIKACPCGALHKKSGGTVAIDYELCCGHGTCVEVCPYGAIYLDPVAKQAVKCHNCYHRAEHELEPACVSTCPSEALYFGDLNDPESKVSKVKKEAEKTDGVVQLRKEKETRPRMWFSGQAAAKIEPRVPVEGESYSPEAYSIYNWKAQADPANEETSRVKKQPRDEK